MRNLRYLNTVLTLIAVLLTLNLWTVWTAGPAPALDFASDAQAATAADPMIGNENAADRQKQMIDQLKTLNDKVDVLDATLTSGKVRVTVDSMPR